MVEMAILMVAVAGDAGGGDCYPNGCCCRRCRWWRWPFLWLLLQVMQVVEVAILMVAVAGDAGGGDGYPNG